MNAHAETRDTQVSGGEASDVVAVTPSKEATSACYVPSQMSLVDMFAH